MNSLTIETITETDKLKLKAIKYDEYLLLGIDNGQKYGTDIIRFIKLSPRQVNKLITDLQNYKFNKND